MGTGGALQGGNEEEGGRSAPSGAIPPLHYRAGFWANTNGQLLEDYSDLSPEWDAGILLNISFKECIGGRHLPSDSFQKFRGFIVL